MKEKEIEIEQMEFLRDELWDKIKYGLADFKTQKLFIEINSKLYRYKKMNRKNTEVLTPLEDFLNANNK
jgi:hypothetical protein